MSAAEKLNLRLENNVNEPFTQLLRMFDHPLYKRSVVINLFENIKFCSFNCTYCQFGASLTKLNQLKSLPFRGTDSLLTEIKQFLLDLPQEANALIFAARGETTLHPDFVKIAQSILDGQFQRPVKFKTILKTNGAHLAKKSIFQTANLFDIVQVKLDVSNDFDLRRINQPLTRIDVQEVVRLSRKLNNCIVESSLLGESKKNLSNDKLDDWLELVGLIEPVEVHLIPRPPQGSSPEEIEKALDQAYFIQSKLKRRVQSEVRIFEQDPLID